ncbi:TPA: restriction endonuclease subunit S [Yersinia enterocolitica]|uniref:restriction endonuclease subunit S n=1 Tax=Yersinia enterocolitica TaxID=630 RepID=UPI000314AB3A|nr:restriction endonuclease subunit S [Yersinia enterocolitica]HED4487836.1 restriction endonuclease subunit S [Yersinia enterocolitica]HEF7267945.1 restriction endonuclease subunit S [Yersinia enterocolitica]
MSIENKVPEIRFKGFSGDISTKNLKEIIITNTYGPRFNANDYDSNGNVKTIRGTDISIDGRVLYNQVPLASLEVNFIKEHTLEDGDLVMITTADCGLTGLFEKQTDKYICSAYAVKVTLDQELASPLYFKYFFQTTLAKTEINKFIRKATVANLPASAILQIAHKIPCKKEQTAIGNYFQQLDNLINQHQQKHDKLSSIKKAMLEKMFPKQGETIPEIRFKGFSGEWQEKELGTDVAEIIGGGTPSTSISEFWNGDIDWYSPTEIGSNVYAKGSQKKITALGLKNSSAKILPAGNTVLFTSRAGIGDMAILAKPGATNQGFQSFIVKEGFSPYFIYSAGKQIKEFALKHASGSTFLEISGKQLGRMKILMPNPDEQIAIGNYFQKLDTLINQHQQQITKLNNIKQACLSKMFI